MINKSWKKLLSVLLSVAMLLSLMPGIGLIASADTVSFTKVTDASQITAENIGTCTADEAKAWALANWGDLLENSFHAEIAFYSNTGELYYVHVYQGIDEQSFLQYFDNLTDTTSISDLQGWFADGHSVFICTPAAAPATSTVSFTKVTDASDITADNIGACTFDDAKAWALANWNTVASTTAASFWFAYYDGADLKAFNFYPELGKDEFETKPASAATAVGIDDLTLCYNYSDDVWLCTPTAAPAVTFTIVTNADQIAADNIGECTFDEAKAWVYDNWDAVTNGVDSTKYIDILYIVNGSARLIGFSTADCTNKDVFQADIQSDSNADLAAIKNYYNYGADVVYICSKAAAPAVSFTIVTDGDQVAADSIGECTFDEAKAWVYDNWDAVTNGVAPSKYIDIVYIVSGSARMIAFFTDECTDKDVFKLTIQSDFDADLAVIKDYYNSGSDVVYVCSKAAAPAHVHSLTPHAAEDAGCTIAGNSAYWYCQDCNKYFSDENGETEIAENSWVIQALGHNYENVAYSSDDTQHWKVCARCSEDSEKQNHTWGSALYVWGDNNSTVTASHGCTQCGKQVSETVNTTASVSGANCTEPERTTYTANFTKDGFVQQVKSGVQTGPALGHNYENVPYSSNETEHWRHCSRCNAESDHQNHTWGEATYTWSGDNSTVTASHSCVICGKQVSETVDTTSQVTAAATCTTAELATYTATFTKDGFTTQTKPNVETSPATGHDFSYAGLNETIIATCSHNGCEYHSNGAFIVIHAPALTTYGGAESASATLEGVDAFNAATGLSVSENAIQYYNTKIDGMEILKDGLPLPSPAGAGTYWAEIKIQNATAYVVYTIAKANPTANDFIFSEPDNLNYNGNNKMATVIPQDGVDGMGDATVRYYSDAARTNEVDYAKNAGTYYVGITVNEGDNYNAASAVLYDSSWKFTVAKADPTYTAPTGLTATYGDALSSVSLPDGWTWEADLTTPVGNAGSNVFKAKFTPNDTDNYNVVEHVNVTVSVGKAASSAATVTAIEWTFDGTAHALLAVTGEAVGGTMQYALGTAAAPGTFGDSIPEATDPDTYYVWYKVAGDANHNDTDAVLVTVVVAHDEALDAVIAAIDAIGPVTEVLADQKAKIDAARAGYNALTPEQQTLVTNYTTLLGAEADYKALFVFDANTQITISGVEKYGETLTAAAIDVPAFITDAVVRWYNEDGDLLGTGETYTLTAAEIGKSVRAELYSAEANDAVTSDFTGLIGKGVIKNYTLPTAAHVTYPQTLAEATLTGGDTGDIEGVWAWATPAAQPTSAQSGSSFELTFTPTGIYADLYEGFTTRLAVVVDPAPFEPQSIEDTASGLTFDAEFAQNVEIELTDIAYSQSAYLALLRASKKDDSGMTRLVLLKTIVFTIGGEAADEAYNGAVTVTSYVGAKLAGQTVSVWFFIDGEPVNYVGTVGYDGVLVIENVAL